MNAYELQIAATYKKAESLVSTGEVRWIDSDEYFVFVGFDGEYFHVKLGKYGAVSTSRTLKGATAHALRQHADELTAELFE